MALCYKLLMAYVWSWTGPFRTINSRVLCCFCHVFVWVLFRPEDCMMNRVTRFICDLGKHLVIFMAHLAKCRGKIENWKAQRKLPPFFCSAVVVFFSSWPRGPHREESLARSGRASRASKWLPPNYRPHVPTLGATRTDPPTTRRLGTYHEHVGQGAGRRRKQRAGRRGDESDRRPNQVVLCCSRRPD